MAKMAKVNVRHPFLDQPSTHHNVNMRLCCGCVAQIYNLEVTCALPALSKPSSASVTDFPNMNRLGSSEFRTNRHPAYPMYPLSEGRKPLLNSGSFPSVKGLSNDPIMLTNIRHGGDMTSSVRPSLVCKI